MSWNKMGKNGITKVDLEISLLKIKQYFEGLISFLQHAKSERWASWKVYRIRFHYEDKTHTAILEFIYDYVIERKWRRDKIERGKFKVTTDRGWNWLNLEYENVQKEDLEEFIKYLRTYNLKMRRYPKFFQKYNPSKRVS